MEYILSLNSIEMIADNLQIVKEEIKRKCIICGRNPEEITLIAVSKTQPVSAIKEVFDAGTADFGENKAQELRTKADQITNPVRWHMIGHLQANKVKYVVGKAEYIHSVDSEALAGEIGQRAQKEGIIQKILIEINTSGEASKFGLSNKNNILDIANFCRNYGSLKLCGLMTMAPFTQDQQVIRDCFRRAKELLLWLNEKGLTLTELSMGMTNDFEIAIEEGATMLRIGTAIFGERNYSI